MIRLDTHRHSLWSMERTSSHGFIMTAELDKCTAYNEAFGPCTYLDRQYWTITRDKPHSTAQHNNHHHSAQSKYMTCFCLHLLITPHNRKCILSTFCSSFFFKSINLVCETLDGGSLQGSALPTGNCHIYCILSGNNKFTECTQQ